MDDIYTPRDLGDGLVLRWSTPEDVDLIGSLGSTIFRQSESAPLNDAELFWMRDLASGRHPLAKPNGGLLVEDTRTNTIAASLWTLWAPWRYGDITFEIGRPEEVITDPAYRNRGLVRALFERFHQWSEQQGHLAQGITGIPYFYRQFGYEFAVNLGGGPVVMFGDIPEAPPSEAPGFTLREATADDLPWLQQLYQQAQRGSILSSDVPSNYWQWMLDGVDHTAKQAWRIVVALDASGTARGAFLLHTVRWGTTLMVHKALWEAEHNVVAAIKPVLRALRAYAPSVPPSRDPKDADRILFDDSTSSHFLDALKATVTHTTPPPYAWYVRVPDLPRFIMKIAPVLEQRVRESAVAGFDGELRIDFYRGGLLLRWEQGKLVAAEPWKRIDWVESHARFPPQVFLQVVFGRRSLDELRHIFPDVSVERDYELLMQTLFPTAPSHVLVLN